MSKGCFIVHLLGNAPICASIVLECSCCRIHLYVAAPPSRFSPFNKVIIMNKIWENGRRGLKHRLYPLDFHPSMLTEVKMTKHFVFHLRCDETTWWRKNLGIPSQVWWENIVNIFMNTISGWWQDRIGLKIRFVNIITDLMTGIG